MPAGAPAAIAIERHFRAVLPPHFIPRVALFSSAIVRTIRLPPVAILAGARALYRSALPEAGEITLQPAENNIAAPAEKAPASFGKHTAAAFELFFSFPIQSRTFFPELGKTPLAHGQLDRSLRTYIVRETTIKGAGKGKEKKTAGRPALHY